MGALHSGTFWGLGMGLITVSLDSWQDAEDSRDVEFMVAMTDAGALAGYAIGATTVVPPPPMCAGSTPVEAWVSSHSCPWPA